MDKIVCTCGNINPAGTELCESCGRPLNQNISEKQVVDMRYEGSARRSQTYKTTIIDKIWNFFSSVKVGMWIIVNYFSCSCDWDNTSTSILCSGNK